MSQSLKISIGMQARSGAWGGGNAFVKALSYTLNVIGIEVSYDLSDSDLDIILLMDPRKESLSATYTHQDIVHYLKYVNPNAIVVHRINECDERKNTRHVNQILRDANQFADHTVFVSAWLRDLHLDQGMTAHPNTVIHNGSDQRIFNMNGHQVWNGSDPLKIVTHHWSDNWNKGFDIYQKLDQLLAQDPYKSIFEFAYIGNIPADFAFENSQHIMPLSGEALADALREHHVYISGSLFDPGPNHQNEGGNCGLPFLYRPSGGLTEYCQDFGIALTLDNLPEKLMEMVETYEHWQAKIADYPYTSDRMAAQYRDLFVNLVNNREAYLAKRAWFEDSWWLRMRRNMNLWMR